MDSEIIIVSGLPRSGTSLMMQMLAKGGVEAVTDNIRTADTDNPRGYYEFEKVKKIKEDASWLPETRGKASRWSPSSSSTCPASETYRVIFMERDLDEMLVSQEKMLERLNRARGPAGRRQAAPSSGTSRGCAPGSAQQKNIKILRVSYNDLVEQPDRDGQARERVPGRQGQTPRPWPPRSTPRCTGTGRPARKLAR